MTMAFAVCIIQRQSSGCQYGGAFRDVDDTLHTVIASAMIDSFLIAMP